MTQIRRSDLAALVLAALALSTLGALLPGKIDYNHGTGADGFVYAGFVEKGYAHGSFWAQTFPADRVGRLLPSACVYHLMQATGATFSYPTLIAWYSALNVVLAGVAALGFGLACRALHVGRLGAWIGALGTLLSFGVWTWPSYYPVLTDQWAYATGLWMLVCWLNGWTWGLTVLTALSPFIWPALPVQGAALLLFPVGVGGDPGRQGGRVLAGRLAFGLLVGVTAFCVARFIAKHPDRVLADSPLAAVGVTLARSFPYTAFVGFNVLVLALSLGAGAAFLYPSLRGSNFRGAWGRLGRGAFQVGLALGLSLFLLNGALRVETKPTTSLYYLTIVTLWGTRFPLAQATCHPFFFGPLIILAVLRWPAVTALARRLGLGLVVALLFGLGVSFNEESRHLLHFFPLVALLVVRVLDRDGWSRAKAVCFVVVASLLSRIYWPIGPLFSPNGTVAGGVIFAIVPFFSTAAYLTQAAISACVFVLFAAVFRRPLASSETTEPALVRAAA